MLKIVLYYFCRNVKVETVKALAQDHRNDILSNFVALISGLIGKWNLMRNQAFSLLYNTEIDYLAGQTLSGQINIRFVVIDPSEKPIVSHFIPSLSSWCYRDFHLHHYLLGFTSNMYRIGQALFTDFEKVFAFIS